MQASVVISYYKNTANLELILLALNRQTNKNTFEVIISEDGNDPATIAFIKNIQPKLEFPLLHVFQEDIGFRKCKALNNAIISATTDFIIFIDGDCIPHSRFIEAYLKEKKNGRVLYGRRVMLSEKISNQLLQTKNISKINLFNLFITGCDRIEEGLYMPFLDKFIKPKKSARLLGCNMAVFKKDLLEINGFDEDYESSGGGEDSDIEWRLELKGDISFHSMKFKAIVYHIYHPVRFVMDDILHNKHVWESKQAEGLLFCKNGLKKIG